MPRVLNFIAIAAALALPACAPGALTPTRGFAAEAPQIGSEMFRAADGTILPMRSWLPDGKPRAIVVALHGFGDYSAAFRQPGGFWARQGVATFAYDQRGFGGAPHTYYWAGTDAMVEDAKSVVRALRGRYPGIPVYLLGESMGGAVAIVAAAGAQPAAADGVILISPAVWEHNLMGGIERTALWLTRRTVPGLWLEPPRGLGIHASDNIAMLRAYSRDSLVQHGARIDTTAGLMDMMDQALADIGGLKLPTLALFGAHEEVLPAAGVKSFLGRLPAGDVRAAVYPHGYHMLMRDLNGEIVAKDVLTWMLDRSAPLPSGDECRPDRSRIAPASAGACDLAKAKQLAS